MHYVCVCVYLVYVYSYDNRGVGPKNGILSFETSRFFWNGHRAARSLNNNDHFRVTQFRWYFYLVTCTSRQWTQWHTSVLRRCMYTATARSKILKITARQMIVFVSMYSLIIVIIMNKRRGLRHIVDIHNIYNIYST